MLLARLIDLYSLIVLGAVIVSWVQLPPYHPVVKLLNTLTEPALAPIRKVIPPMGGLDITPMLLLILLQLIKGILV
jgi:YggT family protein